MAPQSRATAILLTRPAAQSGRFADALREQFGAVPVVVSPLMEAEFVRPALPGRSWAAVIFTSETGVISARRIAADGVALPRVAFCVGDQTAQVAREDGFDAVSAQGDGLALARLVVARGMGGPLLYLHGAEVRVDLAAVLNSAGIETVSAVVYAQRAQALSAEAVAVLRGEGPVIVPVFSARSGRLLAAEYARLGGVAPLWVAAISVDAAEGLPASALRVAARPNAADMLAALDEWLA